MVLEINQSLDLLENFGILLIKIKSYQIIFFLLRTNFGMAAEIILPWRNTCRNISIASADAIEVFSAKIFYMFCIYLDGCRNYFALTQYLPKYFYCVSWRNRNISAGIPGTNFQGFLHKINTAISHQSLLISRHEWSDFLVFVKDLWLISKYNSSKIM